MRPMLFHASELLVLQRGLTGFSVWMKSDRVVQYPLLALSLTPSRIAKALWYVVGSDCANDNIVVDRLFGNQVLVT